jgi:hypothetical protein
MENNEERLFEVGELVKFTGHNIPASLIPPIYILGRNSYLQNKLDLGIIVSRVSGYYEGKAFKVYWFRTRLITETFATHLMWVY